MNEQTVQAVVMRYAMEEKNHEIVLPNVTAIYRWEADLLSFTRAGIVHEYEVKVSKADYLADKKKEFKHEALRSVWQQPNKRPLTPAKQQPLLGYSARFSLRTPNYFWYVTWGFEVAELPPYAGWMSIEPSPRSKTKYIVSVRHNAPLIHTNKLLDKKEAALSRLLSYKLKNMYELCYLGRLAAAPNE